MEALQRWIMGIAVTAVLAALARMLTERTAARGVIRFFGGLCTALAILMPLRDDLAPALRQALTDARQREETAAERGSAVSGDLTRRYAAAQAEAWLQPQLDALSPGISVAVELSDELMPVSASLRGPETVRERAVTLTASALALEPGAVRYLAREEGDG